MCSQTNRALCTWASPLKDPQGWGGRGLEMGWKVKAAGPGGDLNLQQELGPSLLSYLPAEATGKDSLLWVSVSSQLRRLVSFW